MASKSDSKKKTTNVKKTTTTKKTTTAKKAPVKKTTTVKKSVVKKVEPVKVETKKWYKHPLLVGLVSIVLCYLFGYAVGYLIAMFVG